MATRFRASVQRSGNPSQHDIYYDYNEKVNIVNLDELIYFKVARFNDLDLGSIFFNFTNNVSIYFNW